MVLCCGIVVREEMNRWGGGVRCMLLWGNKCGWCSAVNVMLEMMEKWWALWLWWNSLWAVDYSILGGCSIAVWNVPRGVMVNVGTGWCSAVGVVLEMTGRWWVLLLSSSSNSSSSKDLRPVRQTGSTETMGRNPDNSTVLHIQYVFAKIITCIHPQRTCKFFLQTNKKNIFWSSTGKLTCYEQRCNQMQTHLNHLGCLKFQYNKLLDILY